MTDKSFLNIAHSTNSGFIKAPLIGNKITIKTAKIIAEVAATSNKFAGLLYVSKLTKAPITKNVKNKVPKNSTVNALIRLVDKVLLFLS